MDDGSQLGAGSRDCIRGPAGPASLGSFLSGVLRRSARFALAALLLACVGGIAVPVPAWAQSETLLSNLQKSTTGFTAELSTKWAVEFRTGTYNKGYNISGVDLLFQNIPATYTPSSLSVEIWSSAGNHPDSLLHSLSPPATMATGVVSFTMTTARLSDRTDYWIVLEDNNTEKATLHRTASGAADAGVAAGWRVGDTKAGDTLGSLHSHNLQFAVKGATAPNEAPTVANALVDQITKAGTSFTYQFASNTFADTDGDPLTYSAALPSGADLPSWLSFDRESRTFSGEPPSAAIGDLVVRVTANDSVTTVTDDFTITVQAVPLVTLALSPSSISESGGSSTVTASVDPAASAAITVTVSSAAVSPATSSDFTQSGTTLSIAVGATTSTGTVTITAVDNARDGPTKQVTVSATASGDDALAEDDATLSITDDDDQPTVSIADASVTEGDSGTATMTFTVSLSGASDNEVTARWLTSNGTAEENATAGEDYTAVTNGTATIPAGDTSVDIEVTVTGDETDEHDETFTVTLTSATNAGLSSTAKTATGTITDDDPEPILYAGVPPYESRNVPEGDAGERTTVELIMTLSRASGKTVSVETSVSEQGDSLVNRTRSARGQDFVYRDYTTLTFPPGTTEKTVTAVVLGDNKDENVEFVGVITRNRQNARTPIAAGLSWRINILDDDDPPTISIADKRVTETDTGTQGVELTVSLSAESGLPITVDWATADGTATAGADYTAANGTLTFEPGDTTKTITVAVAGDELNEADETLTVSLSNAETITHDGSNPGTAPVAITDSSATLTIDDNDAKPVVSIADASAEEGETVTFTVSLSAASGQETSVRYATSTGTATAADFTAVTNGTATVPAGETSTTFAVTTLEDSLDEDDETFTVTLSSPTNADLSTTARTATGTITDDDPLPSLSIESLNEVTEGDVAQQITVTLDAASGRTVTVDWATGAGTTDTRARAGQDYTANDGTLTFTPGTTEQTITVRIREDLIDEPLAEDFTVTLTNAQHATISNAAGKVRIIDDDDSPDVTVTGATVTETDTGNVDADVVVRLQRASGLTVTLDWATEDGTATEPADYRSGNGTLTFDPGDTQKTITVRVKGDTLDEDNETFTVRLTKPSGSNAGTLPAAATVTITDNDPLPELSIADASGDESGTVEFTVTLDPVSGRDVEFNYASSRGASDTAEAADFTQASGSLTIPAGETTKTVAVTLTDDMADEDDETFTMTISGPTNATIPSASNTATGTITDDDDPPALAIADAEVIEPDGTATRNMQFTVTLAGNATEKTVTVDYATSVESGDLATSGTDFTAASGTLTFAPGQTQKTFNVAVKGDDSYEGQPTETFTVTLSNEENATLADATATGTIQDDEGPPRLSIADATKTAPESGSLTFTVTLLGDPTTKVVTVDYATSNGTDEEHATAGEDYTATSGTLTFPANAAGGTTRTFSVSISSDNLDEYDETFTVTLSNEQNAEFAETGDETATGTITDDDPLPTVRMHRELTDPDNPAMILLAAVGEDSGPLRVPVSLSAPSGRTVTVTWRTADGHAQTDATAGDDYTAVSGGELEIPPGDTLGFAEVTINDDSTREGSEVVVVQIDSVEHGQLDANASSVRGSIEDDEGVPSFSVADATADENAGTVTFTVTLSGATEKASSVDWATSSESGDTATVRTDYTAASGTVDIAAEATSGTFTVDIADDSLDEADETFSITLSSPVEGQLASDPTATGTITDDDDPPAVTVAPATARENAGRIRFTATLAGESGREATLDWTTADDTATAGADYTAVTAGTVIFPVGQTVRTFDVALLQDTISEADETFTVNLASADGTVGVTASQTATGTIEDDEGPPGISIADARSATESGTIEFTATLSNESALEVTATWATADGTATAGTDYTGLTGQTLTFAPGEIEKTLAVTITDDEVHDPEETFKVVLSGPTNATIRRAEATGTITDNDGPPVLSIADATLTEGDSGDRGTMTFTVTMAGKPSGDVTVDYATRDGTATIQGPDYEQTTGTLTFDKSASETTKTIGVAILGDDVFEGDEQFTVRLSNALDGADRVEIADGVATGTIDENEAGPELVLSDTALTIDEGNATGGTFTVRLRTEPVANVTVRITAPSGSDLTVTPAQLEFSPANVASLVASWDTPQTVTVVADQDDDAVDDMAALTLRASSRDRSPPLGYSGLTETLDVTVTDPDTAGITVTAADPLEVNEGESATYTVALATAPTANVTIEVSGAPAGVRVSPTRLTFTPRSWGAKTVMVRGDQDADSADITATLSHTVTTTAVEYASETADPVEVRIGDDDKPGLRLSERQVVLTEGYEKSFTVVLNVAPTADVTVAFQGATGDLSVTPSSLTFTTANWNRRQTVTLALAPDADNTHDGDVTLTPSLTSTDTGYNNLADVPTIAVTQREMTVSFSRAEWTVPEGRSVSVELRLAERLLAGTNPLTVPLTVTPGTATLAVPPDTEGDYTVGDPQSVTFGPGDISKTFLIRALRDSETEPEETLTLGFGSLPSGLLAGDPATAVVTITRYRPPPPPQPTIAIGDAVADEGGGSMTFTVTLSRSSTSRVRLGWATADGTATAGEDYTAVTDGTLTFGAGETEKTIEVTLLQDDVRESDETFTVTLSDAVNAEIASAVATGTIADDEAEPGLVLPAEALELTEGEESGAAYQVALTTQPAEPVTVTLASSDPDAAAVEPSSLEFTPETWSVPQTVTVRGLEDADTEDETVRLEHRAASADALYDGLSAELAVQVIDAGLPPGLVFSAARVSVTEGEAASYTVALNRAPADPVTVTLASSDPDAAAVEPSSLEFTPETWSVPQTVTVRGLEDADTEDETATVRHFGEGVATGTVTVAVSEPAAPAAQIRKEWFARFVRSMSTEVVDMLDERLRQGSQVSQLTLGGQRMVFGGLPGADDGLDAGGRGWRDRPWAGVSQRAREDGQESWTMGGRELLLGSSFHLMSEGVEDAGARLSGWGRVSPMRFASADGGLGAGLTGLIGADYEDGRVLSGVALSFSEGSGSHEGFSFASELTGVHPYFRYSPTEDVSLWSLLGYGTGHLTWSRTDDDARRVRTELGMSLVAMGARGTLATMRGFDIALKSDAFVGRIGSGASGPWGEAATASRVRVLIEGSRTEDGVSSRFGAGLRQDGGDDRSVSGIELGAKLDYARSPSGVSASASLDGFVTEDDKGEWSAAWTLGYDPGAAGRGIGVAASLSWGEASGSADGLWSRNELSEPAAGEPEGRASVRLGYGLVERGTSGLMTPFMETHWSEGGALQLRGGVSLVGSGRSDGLRAELAGERVESGAGVPEHRIGLTLSLSWGR